MLPLLFEQRMKKLLGEEYPAFAKAYDRPRNVGLRLNPLKTQTPPELPEYGLEPVPWAKYGYYYNKETRPGLSPYHEAGLYYLQEPSAMAPAGLLQVEPGMRVLDLCAAPGGKTTQLAAFMEGKGLLVCNEIEPKRAKILSRNVERMGIANALVLNEHPKKLEERFAGFFDRILVDAPCSGEGMFRKEEAAVTDWSEETVQMCARRQREILRSAAVMLRPGGRLVYSTCTFSPEENEGTVGAFLEEFPEFSLAEPEAPWFAPGRGDWVTPPLGQAERTCRLWPHLLRGEGHFAAALEKSGQPQSEPEHRKRKKPAGGKSAAEAEVLKAFCRDVGVTHPEGKLLTFGENLFVVPEETPELAGLKVLRPGLELGQVRKGRLEPAHAWALWLKTAASEVELSEEEIRRYLRGETVSKHQTGWTLVKYGGLSLGWAKGSGGVLKNHFPKALRNLA